MPSLYEIPDLAATMADVIQEGLDIYMQNPTADYNFDNEMVRRFPPGYDFHSVVKGDMSAAWNFADSFFAAATESETRVDNISWSDAVQMLRDVITRLREGRPIEDQRVLRYGQLKGGCLSCIALLMMYHVLR